MLISTNEGGRTGWAMGPASSRNWSERMMFTSWMRFTGRLTRSAVNSWSRNTVSPSLRLSWNQSRQVMRLPVQLWKYSCAITASMPS